MNCGRFERLETCQHPPFYRPGKLLDFWDCSAKPSYQPLYGEAILAYCQPGFREHDFTSLSKLSTETEFCFPARSGLANPRQRHFIKPLPKCVFSPTTAVACSGILRMPQHKPNIETRMAALVFGDSTHPKSHWREFQRSHQTCCQTISCNRDQGVGVACDACISFNP